jgi:hypothetical protein
MNIIVQPSAPGSTDLDPYEYRGVSPFMALSPELRIKIYGFLFKVSQPVYP